MWSTPLFPLLPGPLWPGVVAPDKVLSVGQIELNCTYAELGSGHIDTAIWMHYMDSNKTAGEEARRQLLKNAASNLEQVLVATPHKTPTVRPPASYHENYSS